MTKISLKIARSITTALFLFLLSGFFGTVAQAAPRLYFSPSPLNLTKETETQLELLIDTESTSVFGADAVINFPSSDLTVTSVTNGGFFSDFSYAPSAGKLEIHAFFSSVYDSKSGTGTVALIKVKSIKDSGSGSLNFTCTNAGETEIIRSSDGQNVLSCSSLSALTLNYNQTSGSSTNACGGTCGSHYNCNTGLFCSNGFCRNPDCPSESTCGCKTPAPTLKPAIKTTVKPGTKATPQVVVLTKFTPLPSSIPEQSPSPEATPLSVSKPGFDYVKFGIWTALFILGLLLLFGILKLFSKKYDDDDDSPPQITPPTTDPVDQSVVSYPVEEPIQQEQTWTSPEKPDSPTTPIV